MYLKKLGAALAMCVVVVGVTALPAFAHHPIVTASIVCNEQTGSYEVTWTVANGNWENRTMTLDQSSRSVVPLSSYAPDESKSYTESLPGTTSGTTTLTVRGDWSNGGPQDVVNSASVKSAGTCRTPAQPAISVTKSCPQSARVGEEITYTIRVTNSGDESLTGITVDDSILGNLSDSFANALSASDFEEHTFLYTVGTYPDPLVNVVTASGSGVSSKKVVESKDTCQTDVIPPEPTQPEIDIVKEADDRSVDAGDDIGYTVTVSNTGDGTAEDVELTDELPADQGLDWEIASTSGGWDCEIAAGTLTCGGNGFDLDPGENATVHITSPTTADTCGEVKNQAEVEWDADDGQPPVEVSTLPTGGGDDDAESEVVRIEVECQPEIQIVKDGPGAVHRGDTITYDFEVTNTGQLDLFDVELTDPICDEGTISLVDDGDGDAVLAVDEVWRYTCTHLVTTGDPDPLPNTATVRGDAEEGEGVNEVSDTDDHVVDILHPAIAIVKTVSEKIAEVGDTVTYTYVIENIGDSTLYDISVDDDILGHIGDIQRLEPGQSATLTKDFVVGNEPVTNVAIATGEDVLGHSVTADDAVTVTPIAGATPPTTPFTGSDAGRLGLLTVVLFGIGLTVVGSTRRRRPERETA